MKLLKFLNFLPIVFSILLLQNCSKETPIVNGVPKEMCGDITANTTWPNINTNPNVPDYLVTCNINVMAKLTLQPGVVIAFKQNLSMTIKSNGSIIGNGTADSGIIMKGETDAKGYWNGLFIESNSPENKLNYVKIQNGGSPTKIESGNLNVSAKAKIILTNCTFTRSIKNGIFVAGAEYESIESLTGFSNNYITDNDLFPISITASDVKNMDYNSQMSKNATDRIQVRGGDLEGSHPWSKTAIPLLVSIGVEVGSSANTGNLTINAGMNIEFESGTFLRNYNSTNGSKGFIKIMGTNSEMVQLKAKSALAGGWEGITFLSINAQNQIDYADIQFGGQYSIVNKTKGNVNCGDVSQDATVVIMNSKIGNSAVYGIHVRRGPGFVPDASNIFTNNVSANYFKD